MAVHWARVVGIVTAFDFGCSYPDPTRLGIRFAHNRPPTQLPAAALPCAQNFPSISRKESLLDAYEYVMYGLVYKYQSETGNKDAGVKVSVFVSFGGLLMKLTGDPAKLNVLEVDSKVYLLMRKV